MIKLLVNFDRNVEASVLFDAATALRMKTTSGADPLDPSLDFHAVIGQLHALKEQSQEFIGHMPDSLVVYRRPQLPAAAIERLEAAAFAAGFGQFEAVGLDDIAAALLPTARAASLVLLHAVRDRISGIVLTRDASGATVAVREAIESVDEAGLARGFLAVLDRGPGTAPVVRASAVQELVDRYWAAGDANWSLDVRGWSPEGWWAVCFSGSDAAHVDEMPSQALRKLMAALAAPAGAPIAVIGDGRTRFMSLLCALMPTARFVASQVADLPGAMVALGRSRTGASGQTQGDGSLEMRLLFDPRIELVTNTMACKRDHSAVSAVIEPGASHQLDHVPAKWHRAGFDVELTQAGESARVRLFKDHIGMDLRTFCARIDSRWTADARLLLRISIPEIGASALVVAQAGREPVVTHYVDMSQK